MGFRAYNSNLPTHLRRQVAQMGGELRQSHRTVSEKSLVESTLKQPVEHLMQEVAALRDRVPPVVGTDQETGLVTAIPRSGSVRMEEKPTRNVSASPMLEVHLQRCEQGVQGCVCQKRTQRCQVGRSPNLGFPRSQGSRLSFATNRFKMLSSDDNEPLIPSTVPASS